MVQAIYAAREFVVKDGEDTAFPRPQAAGIAQGCPLSPHLFVIVMSVIMEAVDIRRNANPNCHSKPCVVTDDVLYADDAMLVATKPDALQHHLD
eukprot:364403-Pyramimonas_sp.AAC.1